jgi:ElaB/YqjD/DUF883 family membrane-anchored ribosome-binding protein
MAETVDNTGATGDPEGAETAQDDRTSGVASARERFQRLGQDFQGRYSEVSGDVRRGAERATSEIRRGAERATSEIRRGAERAREGVRDAGEQARVGYERVRTDAGQISREVSHFVKENPARSVAIAAGIGFLLGLLARRGRNDD